MSRRHQYHGAPHGAGEFTSLREWSVGTRKSFMSHRGGGGGGGGGGARARARAARRDAPCDIRYGEAALHHPRLAPRCGRDVAPAGQVVCRPRRVAALRDRPPVEKLSPREAPADEDAEKMSRTSMDQRAYGQVRQGA